MGKVIDIYGGRDPREAPIYTINEVAHHLALPPSTVRAWFVGMGRFQPIFRPAKGSPCTLSFNNLIEAYVLGSLRGHGLLLPAVRDALREYRSRESKHDPHPLTSASFRTDGVSLFVEILDRHLVNLNKGSQAEMKTVIGQYLKYIDFYANRAIRLHPFKPGVAETDARHVQIDPKLSFGRPVIVGSRVPVEELAARSLAGDKPEQLASDLELDESAVRAALRWELGAEAA